MIFNLEHIDDLIAKVLAGEASAEDLAALETFEAAAPENKVYVEDSKKLFQLIENSAEAVEVDTEEAWSKVSERISGQQEAQVISIFSRKNVFRAAASFLLLAVLGVLMFRVFTDHTPEPMVLASVTNVVRQNLPDGSAVTLNKNTTLTFVTTKKGREVKLKGEAFFEVKHDEAHPFIISVDDLIIKDIGTAFNIKALPGSEIVEVTVSEGEVQFYTGTDKGVFLKAGDKAWYSKVDKTFTKAFIKPEENVGSYSSRIFEFEETELAEVIRQLNEVYGSKIVLQNNELGHCRMSVQFNNEDLDLLLSVIAETLDLQVEKKGGQVILKGEACSQKVK